MTEPRAPDGDSPELPTQSSTLLFGSLASLAVLVVALMVTLFLVGSDDEPNDVATVAASRSTPEAVSQPTGAPTTQADPDPTAPPTALAAPPPAATAVPTPLPAPTATPSPAPTPTPQPEPTAVPPPAIPTPLANVPIGGFDPKVVPAGRVSVPIAGVATFELLTSRPIHQSPGHTAIYLDESLLGEVDIFVPFASAERRTMTGFADVLEHFETDPVFANMRRLAPTTVGGFAAQGYEGQPVEFSRGFYTAGEGQDDPNAGWLVPGRLRIVFVDTPNGVVAITAETLAADADRYSDAIILATEVINSIEFRS